MPRFAGKFKESATRIMDVLVRLGADVVLRYLTADKVSVEQLEKLEKAHLERQGLVQNQLRNLREALRQLASSLHQSGVRTVFLIMIWTAATLWTSSTCWNRSNCFSMWNT
jgi:RecA/RadA recombinase